MMGGVTPPGTSLVESSLGPGAPAHANVLELPGGLKVEITGLRLGGKDLDIGKLNKRELDQIKELFQATIDEAVGKDASATVNVAKLTALRVEIDPKTRTALLVKDIAGGVPANPGITTPNVKTLDKFSNHILEQYTKVLNIFRESANVIFHDDEFPELEMRMSPEARRMARDLKPIEHIYESVDPATGKQKEWGTEVIERASTLHAAKQSAQEAIAHFREKSQELQGKIQAIAKRAEPEQQAYKAVLIKEQDRCDAQKAHHEKVLSNIEEYMKFDDKGWLDCNYWRYLIRDCNSYAKAVDKYIAAPVNLRFQKMSIPGKPDVGFARCGMIADMTNTWYSLEFLQKLGEKSPAGRIVSINGMYQEVLEAGKEKLTSKADRANPLVTTVFDKIVKYKKDHPRDSDAEIQRNSISLLEKELKKLDDSPSNFSQRCRLQSLIHVISQLADLTEAHEREMEGEEDAFKVKLAEISDQRQQVLSDNMLQLVVSQLGNHPEKTRTGEPFRLVHLGLINGHSKKLDKTGWRHDEGVCMEDMAAIFKEFDGNQICFRTNVTAPYMDGKKIYMPAGEGGNRDINLETLYVNVTPQGDTTNDGVQKKINDRAIDRLVKYAEDKDNNAAARAAAGLPYKTGEVYNEIFRELRFQKRDLSVGRLVDEKGGFVKAEDVGMALLKSGEFAVSIGCASGKDRTGVIAERFMMRALEDGHETLKTDNPFAAHIMDADPNMPASRVVFENSDKNGLKVDPRNEIRGMNRIKRAKLLPKSVATQFDTPAIKAWKKGKKERWKAYKEAQKENAATAVKPVAYPFKATAVTPVSTNVG
ncbi:MAG: hypothetical protein H0X51_04875 [Parachlamydiaceae bacterium]|nr:hypothetical protein [Parachlamydiaceae bacterium]